MTSSSDEKSFIIPPRCEVVKRFNMIGDRDCVVDHQTLAPGVYTSRTIVNPREAFIRVINTTNSPQRVKNTIEQSEPLDEYTIYTANKIEVNNDRIEKLKGIISKNVPKQYEHKIFDLIERYPDVFALPEDRMTVNNFYEQKLRMTDDSPTYIKNYRTPHTSKMEMKQQIDKLLASELIEPCASNFNSPLKY